MYTESNQARNYAAFYNGKKVILQAVNLLDAKKQAINHFQPAKTKVHMVAVEVLDADGKIDIQRLN